MLTALSAFGTPINISSSSNVTMEFDGYYDNSPRVLIPGLTGSLNLSAFSFTSVMLWGSAATKVSFDYALTNTSTSPVLTSRISNMAFNTTPNIIAGAPNAATGTFDTLLTSVNQPNGIGTVEFCFTAQSCPGGGNGGVTMGNTGTGTATLYFQGHITSLSIDSAYLRYQSVSCAAGSPCSGSASGNLVSDGQVPEPATWGLIAGSLIGLALARRKR